MEKVLFSSSKSKKVKKRQAKEEENLAKIELDRLKNETPKAKTKTHSKLKRAKDVEHRITAGESTRSGEVTPKLSSGGRTSKAKRSKDSNDLDLEASVVILEETPTFGTKNLERDISEDGKSGDVDLINVASKETLPVCHTPRGSSSGSEDDGSPTVFLCTQDEYVVGWDYGSPRPSNKPDYKSKKKGRRRKYKTKLFSPLQQNRRIIPKKAVSDDMSEAIRVFQEATKKIKGHELNAEGSTDETGAENSSWDSHGSTSITNSQQEKDAILLLEEEEAISSAKPLNSIKLSDSKTSYEIDGEDLIILLDDDADECMVQCTQQVENSLSTVGSSVEFQNADDKINLPNLVLCEKSAKQKQESAFEEDAKNNVKLSTNSCTGSSDMSEIRLKSVSNTTVNKLATAMTTTSSRESGHITKSVSSIKTISNVSKIESAFDDSFDAILETFKDEDIELLSQGLEDKGGKNSKVEILRDNSCNGQNVIPNPSGAQDLVPKESSSYNKDQKLLQNNELTNCRMLCSVKSSAVSSKMLPGANQLVNLIKNKDCHDPKTNSNRKEKPWSSNPCHQSPLTILDTICDSSDNTNSSIQRCTPAEIERKRLEAMQRLEKKRKARALFGCANPVQLPKGPNR